MAVALCAGPGVTQAPGTIQPDLSRLGDGKSARMFNRTVTTDSEAGRTVARLDARAGDGGALLAGVALNEGVIEVDLRGKDIAQQSFLGIAFHVVDWTTYEVVSFRPFNFRSAGAARRFHLVQYISHPVDTWQKLRAERPGQFAHAIEPPPDANGWFHVRIVLGHPKIGVYVDHAAAPSLVVDALSGRRSGGVARWVGNGSDGAFANLKISAANAGTAP